MSINVLFIIWRRSFKTRFFLHFVTDQSQLFSTKRKVCDGNFLSHSHPPSAAIRRGLNIGHLYRPPRFRQHFHQAFPSRLKIHLCIIAIRVTSKPITKLFLIRIFYQQSIKGYVPITPNAQHTFTVSFRRAAGAAVSELSQKASPKNHH